MDKPTEDLIAKFLRGDAAPEEAARLAAKVKAEPALMDVMFAGAELERDLREVIGEFPAVVRRRRSWPILAASALIVVAVTVGVLAGRKPEPPAVAHLLRVEGRVLIVGEVGKRAAVTGEPLRDGEGVETPGTSKAVVSFADGTRLSLAPGAAIREIRNGEVGKRAQLVQGAVTADVRRQPAGRPFTIRAPNAEARVLGTGFSLSVVPEG
ncbi:MAG: FecR domain-containing protein, partial [Candidatus Rokuibacteriota bacterium]